MSTPRSEQPYPGDLHGSDSDYKNGKPQGRNKTKGTEESFEVSELFPHCQPWV